MTDTAQHAQGYDREDVEEATALGVAIVRIQRQLRARAGSDMTPSQSSALARIEQHGPLRLGALAELEGTTAPTMSRVVDSLSERDLIERVPDPLDGRASLVRLRPEGAALLQGMRARSSDALRRALAGLTGDERAAVRATVPALDRLGDLLQAADRPEPG